MKKIDQMAKRLYKTSDIILDYTEDFLQEKTIENFINKFDKLDDIIKEFYYTTHNKIVAQKLYSKEFKDMLHKYPNAYLMFKYQSGEIKYRKITVGKLYRMEFQFKHPDVYAHWFRSCFVKYPMKLKNLLDKMCEYDGSIYDGYTKITFYDWKGTRICDIF